MSNFDVLNNINEKNILIFSVKCENCKNVFFFFFFSYTNNLKKNVGKYNLINYLYELANFI